MAEQNWTFHHLESGYERTTPLTLFWEFDGDPMTDEYHVGDISAEELWHRWIGEYAHQPRAEAAFGPDTAAIHWYVSGEMTFESAPFCDTRYLTVQVDGEPSMTEEQAWSEGFLQYFSWPTSAETGVLLQWARLPAIDKVWRSVDLPGHYETKGGFIQEVTGWKPSPLQPFVNLRQLCAMSGLPFPE